MSVHDKGDRILSLYLRMAGGESIYKSNFCMEERVTDRTFDRDIQTLRNCLSEHYLGEEIIYDKTQNIYFLRNAPKSKNLTNVEVYLLLKILLYDRVLRDDEVACLSDVLISLARPPDQAALRRLLRNEITQYEPPRHGQAIMKILGDLLMMIEQRRMICLEYHIGKRVQKITARPLSLEYCDNTFFLSAVIEENDIPQGTLFDVSGIHSFLPLSTYFQMEGRIQKIQTELRDSICLGKIKKYKYKE